MQVALIAASGTPTAPWQVQIYPVVVVVVVVAVVAHCCCIPLQLALVLALTSAPCACTCAVFLPSTGTNTPLAHVVIITHCNLCWWCFSIRQLVHILHLHSCNLHCVVVVVSVSNPISKCAVGIHLTIQYRQHLPLIHPLVFCARLLCNRKWRNSLVT